MDDDQELETVHNLNIDMIFGKHDTVTMKVKMMNLRQYSFAG